jgi:Tol biopolymer transport system component
MFKQKRKRGDIRRLRVLLIAALVIAAGVVAAMRLNYQPDDLRLLYHTLDGNIHAIHIRDERDEILRNEIPVGSVVSKREFYSPDGQWLAWWDNDPADNDLRLTNTATGETRIVSSYNNPPPRLAWSPDSRYVAFADVLKEGDWLELVLLDIETGDLEQLTDDNNVNVWPSFSPDGTLLAYMSVHSDGSPRLHLLDLATRESRPVISEPIAMSPEWSPDGKWIAFMGYYPAPSDKGFGEIFIIAPDGTNLQRLTWDSSWKEIIGWEN